MEHFILFKDVKNKKLVDVFSLINRSKKLKIENIKLIDMIYMKQSLIGVYIFFNLENQPIYVGKCSSRSFLERIASHFDLRDSGFMNNFLCALIQKNRKRSPKKITQKDLQKAFMSALECKILFIEFPITYKSLITKFENILIRKFYNTVLNKKKYKNNKVENNVLLKMI